MYNEEYVEGFILRRPLFRSRVFCHKNIILSLELFQSRESQSGSRWVTDLVLPRTGLGDVNCSIVSCYSFQMKERSKGTYQQAC
jgi:hypothetical protein